MNSFWGIFWIDASSEETAKQAFIDVGKLCEANAENFEDVKIWLANARHSWLLIIDNADNPEIDYAAFFPSGEKGNIILTTRNPQCRVHATVGCEDLDPLDLQDAQLLLLKAAGMSTSFRKDSQKAAEKVVQALGFHTLAIIQAGAYIRLRFCSLEDYPARFRQQEERLLKYHPKQARSAYGSVFATFEISATHLKSSQDECAPDALHVLQILGFIHFQEIPESLFSRARQKAISIRTHKSQGWPQDRIDKLSELQTSRLPPFMMLETDTWREVIILLESYSFIKITGSGEDLSFSMHPLVHTWTRIRYDPESQKEGCRTAGSIIALSMRGLDYDIFHEKLRSHVTAYLEYLNSEFLANTPELELCQTQYHICCLISHVCDCSKLRYLLDVLEKFKAWAGARGLAGLPIERLAATCLIEEGQPQEAVRLLERHVDTEHGQHPNIQFLLARAYLETNQYQKAISLLEHVVRIDERSTRRDNGFVSSSKHLLGQAYLDNGQYEKAVTLFKSVVEINEKTLALAHRDRLASEKNLGLAYMETQQYEKAARILQHVLEIRRTVLDVTDPILLGTQHELARAYLGMGNGYYERAAELFEQVVEIRERILASDDPKLLVSQHNLALVYFRMGSDHYEKAAGLFKHVVAIKERTLASDNPELLTSQHNLALVYFRMGSDHYEKAAGLLKHVVAMSERILKPEHPELLKKSQRLLNEVQGQIEAEKNAKSISTSGKEI